MARVQYDKWQKISVALLDALADAGGFVDVETLIESVDVDAFAHEMRIRAALAGLIDFGAVRMQGQGERVYVVANSLGADGVRAMRDVWKGKFPTN